jgi:hypothetical protein
MRNFDGPRYDMQPLSADESAAASAASLNTAHDALGVVPGRDDTAAARNTANQRAASKLSNRMRAWPIMVIAAVAMQYLALQSLLTPDLSKAPVALASASSSSVIVDGGRRTQKTQSIAAATDDAAAADAAAAETVRLTDDAENGAKHRQEAVENAAEQAARSKTAREQSHAEAEAARAKKREEKMNEKMNEKKTEKKEGGKMETAREAAARKHNKGAAGGAAETPAERLKRLKEQQTTNQQRRAAENAAIAQERAEANGIDPALSERDKSKDFAIDSTDFDHNDLTPKQAKFADPVGAAKPEWQSKLDGVRDRIAWAIPVGGPQPRDKILQEILEQLIADGAGKANIFIFEDDGSRRGGVPDERLAKVAAKFDVKLVQTSIAKTASEQTRQGMRNGRHLAKHFRYFFDYLFRTPVSPEGKSYDYMAVIEDDLWMSKDCVKFMQSMATVMDKDASIYCASGRVDNGFFSTAMDEDPRVPVFGRGHFQFRRGNHFMAPGWMTSARVYEKQMRPMWLDDKTLLPKTKVTHWDNYMESRMLNTGYDCVFPEVPRLIHMGGGGFSVSKAMQRERFGNLRISHLPVDIDYGNLDYLTEDGYGKEIEWYIEHAYAMETAGDTRHFRFAKLVIVIDAASDHAGSWNSIFREWLGVFGVGGYPPNLFKQRGIHKGVAFARTMSNL